MQIFRSDFAAFWISVVASDFSSFDHHGNILQRVIIAFPRLPLHPWDVIFADPSLPVVETVEVAL